MIKLFITGTDTGVGKTVASAWLCRTLSELGKKVTYIKPVQTGGIPCGEILLSVDEEYVKKSAPKLHSSHCCMNFHIPASPHLVAADENREINIARLTEKIDKIVDEQDPEILIIEGAGGIAVPLNDSEEMVDLCRELGAKPIVVSSTALGTLNHSKLTIEYLKQMNCEGASFILIKPEEELPIIEKDNILRLSQMAPILSLLPHSANLDSEKPPLPEQFTAEKIFTEGHSWIL